MNNLKRLLALGMASAMVIGSLAGCGNKDTGNTETKGETKQAESTAEEDTKAADDNKDTASGSVYYLNFKPEQDEQWQ